MNRLFIAFFSLLMGTVLYGQSSIFALAPPPEFLEMGSGNGEFSTFLDSGDSLDESSSSEVEVDSNNDLDSTYIPLEQWQKDSIYWSLKGVSLGLSAAYFFSELIFPAFEINSPSATALFKMFDPLCHNLLDRTFQYSNGNYMPLCSRCTGMNTGIFLGHFDSFIWDSFQIKGWERWEQGLLHIGIYSLFTLPLIIDGNVQNNTDYVSNNPWRLVNGIMFGYAMTAMADELLQLILDTSSYHKKDYSNNK